ncbi:DddA-like double-stranded DNA deaminase toxin [Kribbella catacumbae]|uniref:DddA-like double-stranded DNA deaminase toxin n=1 Tax=Kribbella catacumbae TaxID=460086 RepID=UPI0003691064|nr:DddA-like double-stranded DNA deaminase toxin [Kribbella catacumbae]
MPSDLQRVAQALVECLDQIPTMVASLQRLAARCRENASRVADSTSNPAARMAALQLDAAARACEEAAHFAAMAPSAAGAWAEQMISGLHTADRRPAGQRGTASGNSNGPDDAASKLLDKLPTRRPDDETRGFRVVGDPDTPELVSGHDEYQQKARDFIFNRGLGPKPYHRLAIESHVEVKFAMTMRERGLIDETIVINNIPCDIPYGCKRYLRDLLPPGARLTVVAPGFRHTFIGREDQ